MDEYHWTRITDIVDPINRQPVILAVCNGPRIALALIIRENELDAVDVGNAPQSPLFLDDDFSEEDDDGELYSLRFAVQKWANGSYITENVLTEIIDCVRSMVTRPSPLMRIPRSSTQNPGGSDDLALKVADVAQSFGVTVKTAVELIRLARI